MARVVERKTAFVGAQRPSRAPLVVGGVITIALGALTGLGISMYADRSAPEQRVVALATDAQTAGDAQPIASDSPLAIANPRPAVAVDAGLALADAPAVDSGPAADAGARDPAKAVELPTECRDYRAALEKLTECRQLPVASRDGIKTALGKLDTRWAALGPLTDPEKRELAEKCTQDMRSIKKSRALCAGGGGASPW